MAAAQTEIPGREGARSSLEVRWIFPGRLAASVAGWFMRFPIETMVVEDTYLLAPHLPGLSVKLRGGRALEVKVYHGSPGLLEVTGCACGRLESWHKWSFPHGPPSRGSADPAGWRQVSKRRRISRFSRAAGTRVAGQAGEPGCAVELTEVDVHGETWWTLGFEATGPAETLRSELDAAVALVFAQAMPGGMEPGLDDSQSYAKWLRRQTGDR